MDVERERGNFLIGSGEFLFIITKLSCMWFRNQQLGDRLGDFIDHCSRKKSYSHYKQKINSSNEMHWEIWTWKSTTRAQATFTAFTTPSGEEGRADVRKAISWLCREYRITSVSFWLGDCLTVQASMRRLLIFLFNHCCSYCTVPTQSVVQTK